MSRVREETVRVVYDLLIIKGMLRDKEGKE